jgi:molybdopterin-binding protein
MLAGNYNITSEQGSSFLRVLNFEYPDASDPTGGTYLAWDLAGYTARMQIRRLITDAAYMIELTTENSGITLEASNVQGEIRIEMTAAQTAALTTSGVYDLELIQGADVIKVIKGNFTLNLEVTR